MEREQSFKREVLLRQMINRAFTNAVDIAMKEYQKTGTKRLGDTHMKNIIVTALTSYKTGIMDALKLHSDLET